MTEANLHSGLALALLGLAVPTLVALLSRTAPYGRHLRAGWGPTLEAHLGWMVMESPAVLLFGALYALGADAGEAVPMVLAAMWLFHYLPRSLVFPFRIRSRGKRMPVAIVCMAIAFNIVNAYLNARWISHFGSYTQAWFTSGPFVVGAALFLLGWIINQRADRALIRLRERGQSGYAVPQGGMYRWVSCPNYLGEIIEWLGWALATWSLAGLAFAAFTVANLLPRALAHHRWYRQEFSDYPRSRRALIPYLL